MGLFGTLHAIRQATKMENDVRAMREGIDAKAISKESLKLQCHVIDYDAKRYSKQYERIWQRTAKGLKGISDIYKQIIRDGEYSNDSLERQLTDEMLAMAMAERAGDELGFFYHSGRAKAIVGLQNGELFYDLTGESMPIIQNSAFIDAAREAGLL